MALTNDRSVQDEHKLRLRVPSKRRTEPRFPSAPNPGRVVSARTDEENRASVGDFIRIRGKSLAFDPEDPRSGVFFIDYGETRSTYYAHISPNLVIARVPDGLSSGPYLLRLRCVTGDRVREGRSAFVFHVE